MQDSKVLNVLARRIGRLVATCLPFWLFISTNIVAGVLVAPTAVYLSDQDRTGRMTVQNPTDSPKEISIYLGFGYPESDSLGNVRIRLADSTVSDEKSAAAWIRVFPRKLVLAPSEKQVVRFVARPPEGLSDGEYWARIVIRSEAGQTTIPSATQADGITTTLNMVMQTAIALKYRTGMLISKVDVVETRIELAEDAVDVIVNMENRGNVAYIGVLKSELVDATGAVISGRSIDLAVYRSLARGFSLPIKTGDYQRPYRVRVSISSQGRKDIRTEHLVTGNSIDYSLAVE